MARVLDLFAAAGGWDEAYRLAGGTDELIGFEMDPWACESAEANGHKRVRGDLTLLDPNDYADPDAYSSGGKLQLLLGGPPCQAWSVAGKRLGKHDQIECVELLKRYAEGDDDYAHTVQWADPRSQLISEPMRWIRELTPDNIALENVPAVLAMWNEYKPVLEQMGYNVWTGTLNAEQHGVPQTRRRAFLLASYAGHPHAPTPTHSKFYTNDRTRLDPGTHKWVAMAEALGWGWTNRPSNTITAGTGGKQTGAAWTGASTRREMHAADAEARQVLRSSNMPHAVVRTLDEPAFTMAGGNNWCNMRWWPKSEAELVSGQQVPAAVARNNSIRISTKEAAVLQSFREDFEWKGPSTNQYTQIGNAVPPKLGAAALRTLDLPG